MKLASVIFICLFLGLAAPTAFGQAKPEDAAPETAKIQAEVGIEELYLAKDDGEGRAGDPETAFTTSDVPIYCVVQLDSTRPATVKMSLVVVKVPGVKTETKIVAASYKTNGRQSRVNFTAAPDGQWIAGSYRADIFIDGKLVASKTLEIQKTVGAAAAASTVKNFLPKAPKSKSAAPNKRPRKN